MSKLSKINNTKLICIVLFVISWFVEYKLTIDKSFYLLVPRIISILLITCYYFTTIQTKPNTIFLCFLGCVLLMNVIFSFDHYSSSAMFLLGVSRVFLIALFYKHQDRIEKQHLLPVLTLFAISLSAILYVFYDDSFFFTMAIFATFFLILLLSISFTAIMSKKFIKGSIAMFVASFLFLISDAFLGGKKIDSISQEKIFLMATLYYIGYVLIIEFVRKNET